MSCLSEISAVETKDVQKLEYWSQISIKTDYQLIHIYNASDSIFSRTWKYKDSIINGENFQIRTNKKEQILPLNQHQKDSVYLIVNDLIKNPAETSMKASCYVGNLSMCIKRGNTELCCSYYSVGEWTKISPNTQFLYHYLSNFIYVNKE